MQYTVQEEKENPTFWASLWEFIKHFATLASVMQFLITISGVLGTPIVIYYFVYLPVNNAKTHTIDTAPLPVIIVPGKADNSNKKKVQPLTKSNETIKNTNRKKHRKGFNNKTDTTPQEKTENLNSAERISEIQSQMISEIKPQIDRNNKSNQEVRKEIPKKKEEMKEMLNSVNQLLNQLE